MEYCFDDTLLLNSFLNKRLFFNEFEEKEKKEEMIYPGNIELIIRPECNQKCEYCYITQFGDKLYPKEFRANNEKLLHNIDILLEYLLQRKVYCRTWELFAGDLFYDNLWFDVIDLFIKHLKPLFEEENHVLWGDKKQYSVHITMPCNCSFAHDDEKLKRVNEYIEKAKKVGIRIHFSWSHDGPYSVDIREKRELDEKYYDNMFNFMKQHDYSAHPMISYEGIDSICDNYDWWVKKYAEYSKNEEEALDDTIKELHPMFLEVRNTGWTDAAIEKYLEFLEHAVEHRFNLCNRVPETMAYHIFSEPRVAKKMIPETYLPYKVNNDFLRIHTDEVAGKEKTCTLGRAICINVSKLSIVPCHRLAYDYFEAGNFITTKTEEVVKQSENYKNEYLDNKLIDTVLKEEKIQSIEAGTGLSAYLNIMNSNPGFAAGCCACDYRFVCMLGCYGSQYETFGDWSIPIPDVCKLMKAKNDFLFKKYKDLGVWDYIFVHPEFPVPQIFRKRVMEFLQKKGWLD